VFEEKYTLTSNYNWLTFVMLNTKLCIDLLDILIGSKGNILHIKEPKNSPKSLEMFIAKCREGI
jgi:hypothetical protein